MSEMTVYQAQAVMPVMDIQQAIERRKQIVKFTQAIMVKGTDYDTIPGTDKDTLLKPGAEKLTTFFGLSPRFVVIKSVEQWGDDGTEPFFYYWYKCQLYRGDWLVGEGDGSCNSHEVKYRYRQSKRRCPLCDQETVIKGKEEYGGGWLCWGKKGGCGAKFLDGDEKIEGQTVGRVVNSDVADQANTILKMAQKRALVAATLVTVNASEFFTQDLEDMDFGEVIEGTVVTTPKTTAKRPTKSNGGNGSNGKGVSLSEEAMKAILDQKLAEHPANAARMVNLSGILSKASTTAEIVKWATLYRAARDGGKERDEAAKQADQQALETEAGDG